MPKDKDRAQNPATLHRKLEKQKALKKGKAQIQTQRTTRLAARNPSRLEGQIAELQALQEGRGKPLTGREKRQLEDAERDLARVRRAREKLGVVGGAGVGGGGKRKKEGKWEDGGGGSGDETDESVGRIPMPKDTPPPIPRGTVARHYGVSSTNANFEPLGAVNRGIHAHPSTVDDGSVPDGLLVPVQIVPPATTSAAPLAKTIYQSAPQVRDLRQEAVAKFVPLQVAKRRKEGEEEEECRRMGLEKGESRSMRSRVEIDEEEGRKRLLEEEERFERELETEGELVGREVRMKEVEDEDL